MAHKITLMLLLIALAAYVAEGDTRYYSVTLATKKAGYTRVQTVPQGTGIKVTSDCLIKLKMLGAPFDMSYQAIALYAHSGDRLPTRYTVSMVVGPQSVTADCRFAGHNVEIDSTANGAKSHKSATLPADCFLLEGNLPETWERIAGTLGTTSGTRTIHVFIPTQGGPLPLKVSWKSPKAFAVEIEGQSMTMEWDPKSHSLVSMSERVQQAVFKLADKDAMKDLEGYEAASRAFAVSNVAFDNPFSLSSIVIDMDAKLAGEKISLDTLRVPTQKFTGTVEKNHAVGKLEIRKLTYSGENAAPYPLPQAVKARFTKHLKPQPMVESDDPEIKALARKLTAGCKDTWQATRKIGDWVHENLKYRITGSGASAALKSKEGDCGPHTMLTIALLRAAGIPARITGGALYSEILGGSFGQHYWTRVWVGEKPGWVPIDTTSGEIGTLSPVHVTLWEGMTGIGSLSIKVLDFTPKNTSAEIATPSAVRHALNLRPDERWTFSYVVDGKRIGTETAKVEEIKADGAARLSYRIDLTTPQGMAVFTGEINVGPDATPLGLSIDVQMAGITQKVTSTVTGGKVKAVIDAAGQKVNREADLPAGGYLVMAQSLVPWDLLIRSMEWKPDRMNAFSAYLLDVLRLENHKWRILREETVPVGPETVPCYVIGASKDSEQFYVSKESGKLLRAAIPAAKIRIDRQP